MEKTRRKSSPSLKMLHKTCHKGQNLTEATRNLVGVTDFIKVGVEFIDRMEIFPWLPSVMTGIIA